MFEYFNTDFAILLIVKRIILISLIILIITFMF